MLAIRLSYTQLKKSTINANQIISDFFHRSKYFDFQKANPGEKYYLSSFRFDSEGSRREHRVSLFIPLRRGDTNAEPRFWIYGLSKVMKPGDVMFLRFDKEELYFSHSKKQQSYLE